MDYIEKLDLQTEDVEEIETLEKHTIINNDPFSVDEYLGHTREFLAIEGEYDDGFNQLNETNRLGINCIVSKRVDDIKSDTIFYTNVKDYEKLVVDNNWTPVIEYCEQMGKPLMFPRGEYLIKSYLNKKSGVDWFGNGDDSIIKIDNSFNYIQGDDVAIKNENYVSLTSLDTFTFKNLTFKYDVKDPQKPLHFIAFNSTKNVIIENCFLDSSNNDLNMHITIDFKGNNQNTIINNCRLIYNTKAITNEGNTLCFRNFSTNTTKGLKIINCNFERLCGGDEIIWVCSNVGDIEDIVIKDNVLKCNSVNKQTSGIYILQTDTPLNGSYNIKNILIENNTIEISNLLYSAIKIGTGLENVPFIENVNINNNKIKVFHGDETLSSAIQINRANNTFVSNNIINGTFWSGILNAYNVENNSIDITDNNGAIVNATYTSKNKIRTNNVGLKNCICASDNRIDCTFVDFNKIDYYRYKNNILTCNDDSKKIFRVTGSNIGNEKLTEINIDFEKNIIHGGSVVFDYGFGAITLRDNIVYNNSSGYAIEGEIIIYADNNTIIKPDGTILNDSKMSLIDANSIPYNIRLSLPLGHKITSTTDFKTYTKTKNGDSSSSWTIV